MTDPTPQTTPTRDEAVPTGWKLVPVEPMGDQPDAQRYGSEFPGEPTTVGDLFKPALASAPAPASGGVDAVILRIREMWDEDECPSLDRVDPLLDELRASLSPAATPVSEAGGEPVSLRRALDDLREVIANEGYKQDYRVGVLHAVNRMEMAVEIAALAKPASSPAGGDVREALARLVKEHEEADYESGPSQKAWNAAYAALSQSTSAGRGE